MAGFCSSSRRLMSKLVSSELRDLEVTSFWLLSSSGSLPYWTKCCYELSTGCLQSSLLCCVTATHSVSNTVRHCVLAVCSKSVANLRKSVIYGNYCPGCVVVYRTSLQELENTLISITVRLFHCKVCVHFYRMEKLRNCAKSVIINMTSLQGEPQWSPPVGLDGCASFWRHKFLCATWRLQTCYAEYLLWYL